jgi:hypothetical protein
MRSPRPLHEIATRTQRKKGRHRMSSGVLSRGITKRSVKYLGAAIVLGAILFPIVSPAQEQATPPTGNQVMGQVDFAGKTKAEKTAGVWIDGQYVGYIKELKGDKKVLLLPGEHTIAVRQTGYLELVQKVVTEPGKEMLVTVNLERDPKAQFSAAPGLIKLKVLPERAAVFVDGAFAGTVNQFSGVGREMEIAPGDHHIKIDLAGYKPFETDVTIATKQKVTIKTELQPGSILQADPAIKNN